MPTSHNPKETTNPPAALEEIHLENRVPASAPRPEAELHPALGRIEAIEARALPAGTFTLLVAAATFVFGWWLPLGWNIAGIAVGLTVFLGALGKVVSGRVLGALINERNLVSLSRFQMVVWTIVVLAAYFGYAMARMRQNVPDPLAVGIDWHLWALVGISTTSLVASPLILGVKKEKEPDPVATAIAAKETREDVHIVEANREGTLYANTSIQDARFTDMFQGDEIGNTSRLDITKVQMFYFTVIAALAFIVLAVRSVAMAGADLTQLPKLGDGIVAILGISHAGYLTGRGVDHTARK